MSKYRIRWFKKFTHKKPALLLVQILSDKSHRFKKALINSRRYKEKALKQRSAGLGPAPPSQYSSSFLNQVQFSSGMSPLAIITQKYGRDPARVNLEWEKYQRSPDQWMREQMGQSVQHQQNVNTQNVNQQITHQQTVNQSNTQAIKQPTAQAKTQQTQPKKEEPPGEYEAELRNSIIANPHVRWQDMYGNEDVAEQIETIVREPLDNPKSSIKWTGILLYGPPGTGKSLMAKAIATSAHPAKFMSVNPSDLFGQYHGESEKRIRAVFSVARKVKPVVLFIDEVDSLLGKRNSSEQATTTHVKTEFLTSVDGVGKDRTGVLIVAATNNPWALDEAVLRRLPQKYYVGLPDEKTRYKILRAAIMKHPYTVDGKQLTDLAKAGKGMSPAELNAVVEAALLAATARRRKTKGAVGSEKITAQDLDGAMKQIGRSVVVSDIEKYREWTQAHGLQTDRIEADKKKL